MRQTELLHFLEQPNNVNNGLIGVRMRHDNPRKKNSHWTRSASAIMKTSRDRALADECTPEAAMLRLDHRDKMPHAANS